MERDDLETLKKMVVLYVEDEAEIREQMNSILIRFCEKVYTAENGQEGLESFHSHHPHIIITDLSMPIMNGMDMSRKIKRESPNTPIVIVTAHDEEKYLFEGMEIGLERFLLKPVDIQLLLKSLSDLASALILKETVENSVQDLYQSLDLNPNFIMIATEDKPIFFNQSFLQFLQYADFNDYITQSNSKIGCAQNMPNLPCFRGNPHWIRDFIQDKIQSFQICICKDFHSEIKDQKMFETKVIPLQNHKYLIHFQEIGK